MSHVEHPSLSQRKHDEQLIAHLLPDMTTEGHDKILDTTFRGMVDDLAKPGADIKATLKFSGFLQLLQLCAKIIDKGNELDNVKKAVVYNKDLSTLPPVVPVTLPSSQGLAVAFDELDAEKLHLLHMAVGLAGEAGEMLEQVVRHVLGAPLDGANVREEAGDATFYIVGLLSGIQTELEEAQFYNKVKLLGKRYKNGYSDAAAQARADKPAGE